MPRASPEYNLAVKFPDVVAQWHPTKNEDLTPSDVAPGSHKKVWWVCEKGHEWEAVVKSRAYQAQGCPYCANKKVWNTGDERDNHLAAIDPDVAAQWHPTKNGKLTPYEVTYGSAKKVWWVCEKGHEWDARVGSRTDKGSGCPYCANKKVWNTGDERDNHLMATHPEVAAQWHPTKNEDLRPEEVTPGSGKKVWWICEKGHEWEAVVGSRTDKGSGCPICRSLGGQIDSGKHPEWDHLKDQWHSEKNSSLSIYDVTPGSHKKVWWKCEKEHEWEAVVKNRVNGSGCPYCSGNLASPEYNLAVLHPDVAKKWHPTKNGDLRPEDVTPSSGKKRWWICEKGHEWEATVGNRVIGETGCPICWKEERRKKSQRH